MHQTPLENVSTLNTRLTPQFGEALLRLMAVEPAERPGDIAAVRDLLDLADVASAVTLGQATRVETTWTMPSARPGPVKEASSKTAAAESAEADSARRGLLSFLGWKKRSDEPRTVTDEWAPEDLERYPRVDLATFPLERELAMLLPEAVAKRIEGLCIGRQSARELTVVVKRPDVYIYDHVSYATQGQFKPVLMLAEPRLIDLAIEYAYRVPERQHHVSWREWLEKKRFHGQDLSLIQSEEQEALLQMEDVKGPAIDAVDRMIKEAISIRASDIHIETYENDVVLRYRIDGILHVMDTWPRKDAAAYIKRVKILANMDIAQEMLPQGGRISVRVSEHEFDLRVSCVPVPDGESIVMRLLPKGTFDMKLEDLGFGERNLELFRKLVMQPHGMLLVSGPTGSGKSTTLYATLAEINKPDRKILTVEDPIEYKMHGVVQVQVNTSAREEEKRLTFARALREFLRQDPDVILVGEIRDDETAAISVQAALTGHLLLSTVHTNDAVTIITRLRDRGVEPFLISSTLIGGIAQRLVRKICEGCKEEIPLHPTARRMFEAEGIEEARAFTGRGCVQCHRTGYRGRIAIYEVLEINDELRDMIASSANAGEIQRGARRYGMNTLFNDGLEKVRRGVVTLEEVKRVCMTI
jgi:type IV pilus assembly protein PilB